MKQQRCSDPKCKGVLDKKITHKSKTIHGVPKHEVSHPCKVCGLLHNNRGQAIKTGVGWYNIYYQHSVVIYKRGKKYRVPMDVVVTT